MSAKPRKQPGPGRPAGVKNITATADVAPSRCPKCGSSQRTPYRKSWEKTFAKGIIPAKLIYRRTRCLDCGQARIDREPVYSPTTAEKSPTTAEE